MAYETPALWESALEGPEDDTTDLLADEITTLALNWANGNPQRLKDAEHILATTPYLEGGKQP